MYSCATWSSSSVVTPGAMCFAASAIARAAIRPGDPHRLDGLGVCTSGPVYGVGAGLPTYSGRADVSRDGTGGGELPGDEQRLARHASESNQRAMGER